MINVALTTHYLNLSDCTYRYDDITYTVFSIIMNTIIMKKILPHMFVAKLYLSKMVVCIIKCLILLTTVLHHNKKLLEGLLDF
jgi:hypothetical protein